MDEAELEHKKLTDALREVLTEGDEGTKKLLIQKIPLFCTDIMQMKNDIGTIIKVIEKQGNDMKWMKYLGGGFVAAAGLLALKALGV